MRVGVSSSAERAAKARRNAVSVSGSGVGATGNGKLESAQNDLRNEAAELGGDFVVYDVATGDVNRVTLSGRAFDCSAGPPKQVPIPVEVRTSGSSTAPAEPSIEERLQKLDELHKKGLITDDERAKRRDEILKGI